MHAELLTRTSNLSEDIKLVKTHQRQTTSYSLLLSAGMVALLRADPIWSKNLTLILVVVISVLQGALIVAFHRSFAINLFKYRASAKLINERLNKIIRLYEKIETPPSGKKAPSVLYAIGFALAGLAGVVLTLCYSAPKLIECICGRGT